MRIMISVLIKKDIISSELEACENLLKHTADKADRKSVEIEIAELKMGFRFDAIASWSITDIKYDAGFL